jgi:phosphatidylglycerophosphatase A
LFYNAILLLVALVFTVACVSLGDKAEARFWKKDPSQVVADETAGQAITLMFLSPAAVSAPLIAIVSLVGAFLAFRLMDIVKPWPARQIQRIPGGWGVVLDDLVAGVYAGILVQIVAWLAHARV